MNMNMNILVRFIKCFYKDLIYEIAKNIFKYSTGFMFLRFYIREM